MDDQSGSGHAWTVGVRFRPTGPIYQFDPGDYVLQRDDRVLVDTERGPAIGTVVQPPRRRSGGRPLHRVVRKADARDLAREDRNVQRERELQRAALGEIRATGLPLKLVKAEAAFDGGRVTLWVAAEDRMELRDLTRRLGDALSLRVDVKQIGARDEAKAQGGLGICGRELCCSSWLREFQPVTVKMAKEQGLSLNPSKLAGQCGRLKCCLRYEYQTYQELRRGLPKVGARVQSVKGDGQIVRHEPLRQVAVLRRVDDGVEVDVTLDDLVAPRADA